MSREVRLVSSILVVIVDLQGVPLDNRAQQVEAGILIPSSAFIKIEKRKKAEETKQNRGLANKGRFLGERAHRIYGKEFPNVALEPKTELWLACGRKVLSNYLLHLFILSGSVVRFDAVADLLFTPM